LDVETEWPLVADEFTSRGMPMPNPAFAMIVGALDDKNVLHGFLVVQMQLHFEPLVLYTPAWVRGLVHAAEQNARERFGEGTPYFAFAGNEAVGGLCQAMGLEQMPFDLFTKKL
jgi:hypothetical protein